MKDTKELDREYIVPTYRRFDVNITGGAGSLLTDAGGKEYIDMGAGIATNSFGACDPEWVAAVTEQLSRIQHASNLYYTDPCARLAALLCEKTGMKKVFFPNSGAEANECAIKTARKWAAENKGPEYFTVVTMKNSFHGRTLATLAATGQAVFHKDFLPLTPGFAYAEPEDAAELEEILKNEKCAAVLLETVQGEGGVRPLSTEYIKAVAGLCERYDVLLMIDEVQTGNGRCGYMYSYMEHGVHPDVVTTAKGLGGGLPVGAVLFSEKTAGVLTAGTHGSTFGGNPVCCAGAISVVSRLDEELFASVRRKSAHIFEKLSGKPGIKGVYGRGLLVGIETEEDAASFIGKCISAGVLVLGAKGRVRLAPPLNIPDGLLDRALDVILAVAEKGETTE